MQHEISTRIALRSDVIESWIQHNPVLLSGETAVVYDGNNVMIKVGNGISSFNQLPYVFQDTFASKYIFSDRLTTKNLIQGYGCNAFGICDIATGFSSDVSANFAQAHGYQTYVSSDYGYVWNGDNTVSSYADHGVGTFNVNTVSGLAGFFVGDSSLCSIFDNYYTTSQTSSATEISDAIKNIDVTKQLSGYVKLSSAVEQSMQSDINLDGMLRVGGIVVQGDDRPYDGIRIANALGSLLSSDLGDELKRKLGISQGFRYKLVNGQLQHGTVSIPGIQEGECDYIHLEDFTVTTVTLSTMNDVVIYLPSASDDRCRDLILKLKVQISTAPKVSFVAESGEDIAFETDDDSWSSIEPGVNYIIFTETERQ